MHKLLSLTSFYSSNTQHKCEWHHENNFSKRQYCASLLCRVESRECGYSPDWASQAAPDFQVLEATLTVDCVKYPSITKHTQSHTALLSNCVYNSQTSLQNIKQHLYMIVKKTTKSSSARSRQTAASISVIRLCSTCKLCRFWSWTRVFGNCFNWLWLKIKRNNK